MFDSTCPRCATDATVRGEATPEGVRLTCSECGSSWLRAERHCASCEGTESLTRPQKLVVNPRGNQLATVGLSEVRLCPACDAAILVETGPGQWLPDGYVSRFLNGAPRAVPAPTARRDPPAAEARTAPAPRSTPSVRPTGAPSAAKPSLTNPTVREAMEASLAEVSGLNAGVTTLLAIKLGPFTRLKSLGGAVDRDRLAEWARDSRLPSTAMETVDALLAQWREQGWL